MGRGREGIPWDRGSGLYNFTSWPRPGQPRFHGFMHSLLLPGTHELDGLQVLVTDSGNASGQVQLHEGLFRETLQRLDHAKKVAAMGYDQWWFPLIDLGNYLPTPKGQSSGNSSFRLSREDNRSRVRSAHLRPLLTLLPRDGLLQGSPPDLYAGLTVLGSSLCFAEASQTPQGCSLRPVLTGSHVCSAASSSVQGVGMAVFCPEVDVKLTAHISAPAYLLHLLLPHWA